MGDDPFVMDLFGGSLKTATCASETSTDDTTARGSQSERVTSLWDPERKSYCAQQPETQVSHGDIRGTAKTVRPASSAAYSEMSPATSRRSLSDRLTPSLISSGLVCGITPLSIRKPSDQPTLGPVFDMLDGAGAGHPKQGFSSSKERRDDQ